MIFKAKIIIIVAIIVLTGCDKHDIHAAMVAHYDRMVCAGAWPDYDDRKPDCEALRGAFEFNERY